MTRSLSLTSPTSVGPVKHRPKKLLSRIPWLVAVSRKQQRAGGRWVEQPCQVRSDQISQYTGARQDVLYQQHCIIKMTGETVVDQHLLHTLQLTDPGRPGMLAKPVPDNEREIASCSLHRPRSCYSLPEESLCLEERESFAMLGSGKLGWGGVVSTDNLSENRWRGGWEAGQQEDRLTIVLTKTTLLRTEGRKWRGRQTRLMLLLLYLVYITVNSLPPLLLMKTFLRAAPGNILRQIYERKESLGGERWG